MEVCVPLQMTLRPFIISSHQYQDVGLLLLPAVIWIVRGERKAMLQHALNWHRCEQRCSQIEDWTLALWEMLFSQQLILSIKCLQSYFKPYISAPQMKLKQFYNGAESQTPLKFIAVEGYCALGFFRYAHPPKSISQACVRVHVFAFFSQVMFSRMSASNNREIILTEARRCCDWKEHVLHSQITETLPSNWCSPGVRPRRVQCFTSQYDKGMK